MSKFELNGTKKFSTEINFLVDEGLVSTYVCIYFFSKQTLRTPWVENHPMKALIQAIIVSGAPLLSV